MESTSHENFQQQCIRGDIAVGVDPAFARKLFSDSRPTEMLELIGESLTLQRIWIWSAIIASQVLVIISCYWAVVGFGWWAMLVVPVTITLWGAHGGSVSIGKPSLWWLALFIFGLISSRPIELHPEWKWTVFGLVALFVDRLKYRTASGMFRRLVYNNSRAYEVFRGEIVIKR